MAVQQAAVERWVSEDSGDEVNWNGVCREQLPRILNYFRFRIGRHADAEDLTLSTFEKAWRERMRFRCDVAAFSTWLFTIARNVGTDYLRARRSHLPIDAALDVALDKTPLEEAEQDSELGRLATLLSAREQELIALKYGAGLDLRSIAQLTGLSESNVGVVLHRAVRHLRAQRAQGDSHDE